MTYIGQKIRAMPEHEVAIVHYGVANRLKAFCRGSKDFVFFRELKVLCILLLPKPTYAHFSRNARFHLTSINYPSF